MQNVSGVDIAAVIIALIALVVAIRSAAYTRREAIAAETQVKLLTEPVFRFAERTDMENEYREYLVIRNIGTARANNVTVVLEADRSGRLWGHPRSIVVLEPNTEEELKTTRPLPHLSQMAEIISPNEVKIEHAEVTWTGVDGQRRTKRVPLLS